MVEVSSKDMILIFVQSKENILSEDEYKLLYNLMKENPNIWKKINDIIQNIINKDNISTIHMVTMTREVSRCYFEELKKNNIIEDINIIHLTKITIYAFLNSKLLSIPSFQLRTVKNLVNEALMCLETNISIEPKRQLTFYERMIEFFTDMFHECH